jgi:Flp pilus assembly CpaE family ATPase
MADEILYVCTPDLPSVAMTKAGLVFLQNSDIPPGKVLIILNRLSPHAEITAKDLEDSFGDYQVVGRIPSDFHGIQSALNRGLLLAELPNPPRPVADGLRALADRIGKAPTATIEIIDVRRPR